MGSLNRGFRCFWGLGLKGFRVSGFRGLGFRGLGFKAVDGFFKAAYGLVTRLSDLRTDGRRSLIETQIEALHPLQIMF